METDPWHTVLYLVGIPACLFCVYLFCTMNRKAKLWADAVDSATLIAHPTVEDVYVTRTGNYIYWDATERKWKPLTQGQDLPHANPHMTKRSTDEA